MLRGSAKKSGYSCFFSAQPGESVISNNNPVMNDNCNVNFLENVSFTYLRRITPIIIHTTGNERQQATMDGI
jgi:hypothetical protein